jgi:hypothetical protein
MMNMGAPEFLFSMVATLVPLLALVWIISTLVRIRRAVERMATRLEAIGPSSSLT